MSVRARILGLALLALPAGCTDSLVVGDVHELPELPEPPELHCARSSFLRSTPTGTEVIFLEAPASEPAAVSDGGCMARAFVEHDSSTTVEVGTYTLDATGAGQFVVESIFHLEFEPNLALTLRTGATRQDLDSPEARVLSIEVASGQLLVDIDGETRRLTSVHDVVDRLDPTYQAGAEDVFRLLAITRATMQARIPGLSGAAETMYVGDEQRFEGLAYGSVDVSAEFLPAAELLLAYTGLEDLAGIVLDGEENRHIDIEGYGAMSGVVDFEMSRATAPKDVALTGSLGFFDVIIGNGYPAGGYYTLTIDGAGTYSIGVPTILELTSNGLLPIETP